MKITLLLLLASFALVGCSSNKGGMSDQQAYYSDDYELNRRPPPTRMLGTPLRGANGNDRR